MAVSLYTFLMIFLFITGMQLSLLLNCDVIIEDKMEGISWSAARVERITRPSCCQRRMPFGICWFLVVLAGLKINGYNRASFLETAER